MSFRGMEKHMLIGKHRLALQKESPYDKIKTKWSDYCNNLNATLISQRESSQTTGASFETRLLKGWALKKSCRRLDDHVKAYLAECYNKGEVTEQKACTKDVAETMKYKKDSNGNPVFSPCQWLQPSQVVSFFSRQSCLKSIKSAALIKKEEADLDEEDLSAVTAVIEADTISYQLCQNITEKSPYKSYPRCAPNI